MSHFWILSGIAALAIGVWIGLGAPGWPIPPRPRRRLEKRDVNPISWSRGARGGRPVPRRPGGRLPPAP